MAMTGGEIAIAARLIAPLIRDLYTASKGSVQAGLKKWGSEQFSEQLVRKITSIESVKTLWQFEKEVAVRDFYYPIGILNADGSSQPIDSLKDLNSDVFVIEGIVGQGKSIFLRYLCVQELSHKRNRRIPIFIEMRSIRPGQTVEERVISELVDYGIDGNPDIFTYLADSGKLALLLDGFDELEPSLVKAVVFELGTLVNRFENLTLIVTSRPDCDIQKSAHFPVLKLAPLRPTDYVAFLEKLGLPRDRANEIALAIEQSPSEVSELITTPLMLTLTVLVYRSEKSIPPELDEFFEALFNTVLTRHDKSKPGFTRGMKTTLGERALRKLFETFCFMAAQRQLTRTLNAEQFATAFEKALAYSPEVSCSVEDFQSDICKVTCLMQEEGLSDVTFLHKSIAEYFSAAFIRRQQDAAAKKFYESALNDLSAWSEVLNFLSKIDQYRYNAFYVIPSIETTFNAIGINPENPDEDIIKRNIIAMSSSLSIIGTAELNTMSTSISIRSGPALRLKHGDRKKSSILFETQSSTFFSDGHGTKIIETGNNDSYDSSFKNSLYFRKIVGSIVNELYNSLPDDLSLVEGIVRHRSSTLMDSFELPVTKAIEHIGLAPLISAFKISISQIQSINLKAKKFNDSEDLKQDIF